MAGRLHLYLVASGGYAPTATALQNEIWQTGVRLAFRLDADPPLIGTLPANEWNVVSDSIDRDETAWRITSNWRGEGGVADFDPGDYLNDQAGPAFAAWIFAANSFASNVQLRELRLYPIRDPDGKVEPAPPYAQGTPAVLTWKTPQTGVAGGVMLPPNNTVVASLRTNQIGRRGRGRMYGPPSPAAISGTGADAGVITAAARGSLLTAYKTLLEALAVTTTEPTGSSVRPIIIGAPYSDYAVITSLRIGNIVDTQQRRRRQLTETYSSDTIDYS